MAAMYLKKTCEPQWSSIIQFMCAWVQSLSLNMRLAFIASGDDVKVPEVSCNISWQCILMYAQLTLGLAFYQESRMWGRAGTRQSAIPGNGLTMQTLRQCMGVR